MCYSLEQTIKAVSSFSVTSPVGFTEQADFLNGVVLVSTELDYCSLVQYNKDIESKLGRVKTDNKNGPRKIDLDIIVFNGKVVDDDYYSRDFLRKSVMELMPEIMNNE